MKANELIDIINNPEDYLLCMSLGTFVRVPDNPNLVTIIEMSKPDTIDMINRLAHELGDDTDFDVHVNDSERVIILQTFNLQRSTTVTLN